MKPTREQTLQALRDSIKHWENLRDGIEHRSGYKECALCNLFLGETGRRCVGCPIKEKTGQPLCEETPYLKYYYHKIPENAQKEVDFLKDILIEELSKVVDDSPKDKKGVSGNISEEISARVGYGIPISGDPIVRIFLTHNGVDIGYVLNDSIKLYSESGYRKENPDNFESFFQVYKD